LDSLKFWAEKNNNKKGTDTPKILGDQLNKGGLVCGLKSGTSSSSSSSQKEMRIKSVKTDRHINVEDDDSDTSSTISNNDVDVKEALRSSISLNLKSKFQKGDYPPTLHNSLTSSSTSSTSAPYLYRPHLDLLDKPARQDDEMSHVSTDSIDIGTPASMAAAPGKKEKKPKKPEDKETAAMRRERNRLAAQRCRQRRRDRIDKLEKICDKLENDGQKLETEITGLQSEMSHLQKILNNHKCMAMPPRIKNEREYPFDRYDSRIVSS